MFEGFALMGLEAGVAFTNVGGTVGGFGAVLAHLAFGAVGGEAVGAGGSTSVFGKDEGGIYEFASYGGGLGHPLARFGGVGIVQII